MYKKYFAQITHTLTDIDTLLPYLVSKEVINAEDVLVIKSKPRPSDQVCELLMHIDGPLSVNETTSFYYLLDVMEDHGCITTKQLVNSIKGCHINVFCDKILCMSIQMYKNCQKHIQVRYIIKA